MLSMQKMLFEKLGVGLHLEVYLQAHEIEIVNKLLVHNGLCYAHSMNSRVFLGTWLKISTNLNTSSLLVFSDK
jgi:hypothetical protein